MHCPCEYRMQNNRYSARREWPSAEGHPFTSSICREGSRLGFWRAWGKFSCGTREDSSSSLPTSLNPPTPKPPTHDRDDCEEEDVGVQENQNHGQGSHARLYDADQAVQATQHAKDTSEHTPDPSPHEDAGVLASPSGKDILLLIDKDQYLCVICIFQCEMTQHTHTHARTRARNENPAAKPFCAYVRRPIKVISGQPFLRRAVSCATNLA